MQVRAGDRLSQRILIVEDHELLAQSLTLALRADGFEVQTVSQLTPEAVLEQAEAFGPGVVLLDLDLGDDVGSALPLIGPLRKLGALVLMVTGVTDRARLGECVSAGAIGVVAKSAPFEHLVESVKEAAELGTLLSPHEREELLAEMRRQHADKEARLSRFERLTQREAEVLAGLLDGKSAEVLAKEAFVSLATVRSQIRTLLQKLGVHSQLGAVALARQAEWQPPA